MKLREVAYLFGLRPSQPQVYGYEVNAFDLPKEGRVEYARWLHPSEGKKEFPQEAIDYLRTLLKPGDVVLDIGAHSGDTTLPLALAVGPTGCVLALEPNALVFPILAKNAELNREKTRIVPLNFAAMEHDGQFVFHYGESGFCNGGLMGGISKWRHGNAFPMNVAGRNLQRVLDEEHAELSPRVRHIKVDAEGHDHAVLKTLDKLIARQKPSIRAEVFKHSSRQQREEFARFLFGHGYRVHKVQSDTDYRGPVLSVEDFSNWPHFDIFCTAS